MVFPQDYLFDSGTVLSCTNLDDGGKTLDCTFNTVARLLVLKVNSTTFIAKRTFQFVVSGITNPRYSVETQPFLISNYYLDSNGVQQYEPASDRIRLTPRHGALTSVTLKPQEPTVGARTNLLVQFTVENQLPSGGKVLVYLPKWTPYVTSSPESYVEASTSPSQMHCESQANVELSCRFVRGAGEDRIEVAWGVASVEAESVVNFSIKGVRAPPSQQIVSGFRVLTTGPSDTQLINQGTATLQATSPVTLPPSSLRVSSATSFRINSFAALTLELRNLNPWPPSSTLLLTIPPELKLTKLTSITGRGGSLKTSLPFSTQTDVNGVTTVTMAQVNTQGTDPNTYQYLTLSTFGLPASAKETSSFLIQVLDQAGKVIEAGGSGATLRTQPGSLKNVQVSASTQVINAASVTFRIRLTPMDPITVSSRPLLQVIFPSQLSVANTNTASMTVVNNRVVLIKDVGMRQDQVAGQYTQIEVAVGGVRNPEGAGETESFVVRLGVIGADGSFEVVGEVDQGVTFTAIPSNDLEVELFPRGLETGIDNVLTFKIKAPTQIAKGSFIRIGIPKEFAINDFEYAANTCLRLSGFSDEIACTLEAQTSGRYQLTVRGGFDSAIYPGDQAFSFSISGLRNPMTTEETSSFTFQIYSASPELLQYTYGGPTLTLKTRPAPFSYASVTSGSALVGTETNYTFILTLSVDTEANSVIQVTIPDQISLSDNFSCRGLLTLSQTKLRCERWNQKTVKIYIWGSADVGFTQIVKNGTTVSWEMGPFRNPLTMEPSESFIISTYIAANSNTRYLYYNQEDEGLSIQNTQQGAIQNFLVVQNASDLSSPGQLKKAEYHFNFSSQTAISLAIQILITIPTNLIIEDKKFQVSLNWKNVTSSYLSVSRQLKVRLTQPPADLKYQLSIIDGLRSPMAGPYTVSGFMVEIQSEKGYAIDSLPSQGQNISTECSNKCASCSWSLSNCTSCNAPLYLNSNKCEMECKKGTYADEAAQKCLPCKTPCQECKFSATQCTRCLPGNSFGPYATPDTTLECLKDCPSGTYLDKVQGLCLSCRSPCYTCNGTASLCLSCQSDYKWVERELKCYKECPIGTMAIQSSPQCVECSFKCKSCSEQPDQCSSCSRGQYLFKKQECLDQCPAQYQANDVTLECDFFGEEVFPVPFSVFSALLLSGIFVAWRFNRDTSASEVSLACLDVTSKLNLLFLLTHYFTHSYYLAGTLISVSLVLSLATNLFLFRPCLLSRTLSLPFRPPLSCLILYLSVTLSFHLYRTLQSRLLALKGMSHPTMSEGLRGVMYRVSIIQAVTQIPLVLAGMILVIVSIDGAKLDIFRFSIDGLIVTSALLLNIAYVVLRVDKPQNCKVAMQDLVQDLTYAIRGKVLSNDGVAVHKGSGGLFGRAQEVQEEQREVEKLEWSVGEMAQKKLERRESLLASPMVIQSLLNNNMTPQKFQRVRKSLQINNPTQFNERLLRTLNSTGEKFSPGLSKSVTRHLPLINRVASQESLDGDKPSDGNLIRHFPSVPRRSNVNAQILVQESLGSLGEDGENQTDEGQLETFDEVVAKAMSTLQQTDRPLTNWDYFNVKAMITQLHKLSLSTKSSIREEQARKNLIKEHLAEAKTQSQALLSEEIRLKHEIEDITKRLSEFRHITQLELQEGEQVKRAQSRERQRSRDIERQRMQPDPPPKKQLSTLNQPTLLQMVREKDMRRNSNISKAKAKSIERVGGAAKEEDSIEWINEALNGGKTETKGKFKKEKGKKDASPKIKKQKDQK